MEHDTRHNQNLIQTFRPKMNQHTRTISDRFTGLTQTSYQNAREKTSLLNWNTDNTFTDTHHFHALH